MQGVITSRETTGQPAKEIREEYLNSLEPWERKAQEVIDILKQINKDIKDINEIYKHNKI